MGVASTYRVMKSVRFAEVYSLAGSKRELFPPELVSLQAFRCILKT